MFWSAYVPITEFNNLEKQLKKRFIKKYTPRHLQSTTFLRQRRVYEGCRANRNFWASLKQEKPHSRQYRSII